MILLPWRIRREFSREKTLFAKSAQECIRSADCNILVTEWDEFKKIRPEDFKRNMRKSMLIDRRRAYDSKDYASMLEYYAVGLWRIPSTLT